VTRGELWWVELPEQKRRPYLVISRDVALGILNRVIAVPLTTTVRNIPTEVRIAQDDGAPSDCVASVDNIETVPRWAFTQRIAQVPAQRLHEVCTALKIAVDC
jgi:mRNA interferase MazF